MIDSLSPLVAEGVIDETRSRLKSGKEADLWIVRHGGEIMAAKVYKARETRSFKNNAGYKEGRRVRNSRTQRAIDRGSRFGQAAAEDAWKAKEADALHVLHAAGVRVPKPVLFYEGVLLMELVVDAHGHPAPRLVDAHLARADAAALYADLRGQAVRMLTCDLVHGDLSPYNVLLAWNGPTLIDFPQVVGAAHNSQAEAFFRRDLENVRRFLAGIDPTLENAAGDAHEIWRAYTRRELTPGYVPSGRAPEPHRKHAAHGHPERPGQGPPEPQRGRPAQGQAGRPQKPAGERPPGTPGERQPGTPRSHALDTQRGRPSPPQAGRPPHQAHGRGEQHPRHGGGPHEPSTARPQGRSGPDRRAATGPEVVRIARPQPSDPHVAPHAPAHPGHHPPPGPAHAGSQGGGGAPGSGRRRRRRNRGR